MCTRSYTTGRVIINHIGYNLIYHIINRQQHGFRDEMTKKDLISRVRTKTGKSLHPRDIASQQRLIII